MTNANTPRPRDLVEDTSICQDHRSLSDPFVRTRLDVLAKSKEDCPLMEPCISGQLQREGVRCAALTGHIMARAIAIDPPRRLGSEIRELSDAPLYPPHTKGFIDPYSDKPTEPITDKAKSVETVVGYAGMIVYGDQTALKKPSTPATKLASENPLAMVAADDQFETVYPNGVPERVPRNVCRCPILQVGDFCPVHGG